MKKKTSWQRKLNAVLVCVTESEKGFNSTRRHVNTLYPCRFISAQEESIHMINTPPQLVTGAVAPTQDHCCLLQLLLKEFCVDIAA